MKKKSKNLPITGLLTFVIIIIWVLVVSLLLQPKQELNSKKVVQDVKSAGLDLNGTDDKEKALSKIKVEAQKLIADRNLTYTQETIHELCHVVQSYPNGNPLWVTEGIADYVRWAIYEKKPHQWFLEGG